MINKYRVALKSGIFFEAETLDSTKDITGLWIYLARKNSQEFISFKDCTVLVSEISLIKRIDTHEQD